MPLRHGDCSASGVFGGERLVDPDRATSRAPLPIAVPTASLLFGLFALLLAAPAFAEARFEWSATLPFTGASDKRTATS
jgi:hypothetical protein